MSEEKMIEESPKKTKGRKKKETTASTEVKPKRKKKAVSDDKKATEKPVRKKRTTKKAVKEEKPKVVEPEVALTEEKPVLQDKEIAVSKEEKNEVTIENRKFSFDFGLEGKSTGLHSYIENRFNQRRPILGSFILMIKNILFSIFISQSLYILLNTNAFSFQRLTFSEASNISFYIFLILSFLDLIYVLIVYLLNYYYGFKLKWRRVLSAFRSEVINVVLLMIILAWLSMTNDILLPVLIIVFVMHFLLRIIIIDIASIENVNKKMIINLITLSLVVYAQSLFWPYISEYLIRIFTIMF